MIALPFGRAIILNRLTSIADAEQISSVELQQIGWQSILNNFKRHVKK
jgi:hypothetical protein